jgi:hypothetical protein
VNWKQAKPMSKELGELVVKDCKADEFKDCDLIFSGLDSSVAGEIGSLPSQTLESCLLTLGTQKRNS